MCNEMWYTKLAIFIRIYKSFGAGEMAQWLRALAALLEDVDSIQSLQSQRLRRPLLAPSGTPYSCHTYRKNTCIHKLKINLLERKSRVEIRKVGGSGEQLGGCVAQYLQVLSGEEKWSLLPGIKLQTTPLASLCFRQPALFPRASRLTELYLAQTFVFRIQGLTSRV